MGIGSSKQSLPELAWAQIIRETDNLTKVSMTFADKIISMRFAPSDVADIVAGTLEVLAVEDPSTPLFQREIQLHSLQEVLSVTQVPMECIAEFMYTIDTIISFRTLQHVRIELPYYELIVITGVLYICQLEQNDTRLRVKTILHGAATEHEQYFTGYSSNGSNGSNADNPKNNFADLLTRVHNRIKLSLGRYYITTSGASTPAVTIGRETITVKWPTGSITCAHEAINDSYADLICAAMPEPYHHILRAIPLLDVTILALELPRIRPASEILTHDVSGSYYRITPNYILMWDTDEFLWARRDEPTYRSIRISRDELQTLLREHSWVDRANMPAVLAIIDAIRQLDKLPWKQLDENSYNFLRVSLSESRNNTFLPL